MASQSYLGAIAIALGVLAACDAPSLAPRPPLESELTEDAGPTTQAVQCEDDSAPITLTATAPMGVNDSYLGRPYDKNFEPFVGTAGETLFPKGEIRKSTLQSMDHQLVAYESSRGRDANVGGSKFGIKASAEVGKTSSTRFASYRASQFTEVREINDATEMAKVPAGAVWYLSRIIYGHSFELLFSGDEKRFHAGVKAKFLSFKAGAKTFAESNHLEVTARGRGMEPVNGDAIFARSGDEIMKAYRTSGEPVPIAVEYRSIPRACLPPDEAIEWAVPKQYRLTFDSIDIYIGSGDWNLDATCKLDDIDYALDNRTIWNQRQVPGNKCQRGEGPRGAHTYCPYNLYWATQLEVVEGDTLRCGVSGIVGANSIPYSEFSVTVKAGDPPKQGDFGDGDKNAEYRVKYTLTPMQ